MHLKKLISLVFLFILTFASFNPSFSIPPDDEQKRQALSKRKLSEVESKENDLPRAPDIRDRPAPDFWDSIPVEEFRQAPWQYQCLYCLYNLCCGCFRALE